MTSPEPNAYHNHQLRHQHQQRPGPPHAQQPAYSPQEAALQQQPQPVHPHDPYTDRPMHYISDQHLPDPSPQHRPPFPPHHTDIEQPLDLSLSRSPRPGSTGSMLDGLKRTRAEEPAGGGRSSHSGVCLVKECGCQNSMPIHNPHHYGRLHRHSPYPQFSPSASSVGGHKSPGVRDMSGLPHPATPYSLPPQSSPFPAAPSSSSPSPAMLHEGNNSSSSSSSSSASYYSTTAQGRRSPYSRPGLPGSSSNSSLPPYGSDMLRQSPGSMLYPRQSSTSPLSISPRPAQDNSSPRPPTSQTLPRVRDVSPNRPFYRPFEDSASSSVMEMGTSFSSSSALTVNSSKMVAVERYRHTSEDDLTASSSLLLLSSTSSSSSSSVPASQQFSEHSWIEYRQEEQDQQQQQHQHYQQSVKMGEDHGDTEPSQSDAGQPSNNTTHSQLSPVPPHRTAHPSAYYYKAMSVVNDDRYVDMEASSLGQHTHQHSEESGGHRACSPVDRSVAFSHHTSHNDLTGPASSSSSSTTSCTSSTSPSSSTPSTTTTSSSYPSASAAPLKPMKKFVTVVGSSVLSTAKVRVEREKKQAKYNKERMKDLISSHQDQQQQQQRPQQRPSNVDGNDSEGGSDHSSGQASPRSSDGSEPDVGSVSTAPEGPSLKITPFDYMMMEYLVQTRDVPFKPCNREIRDIYTGVKKGPLTLVDLIELQVEASLMA